MPLNSSGKLSLGGSTVGESVNLELGLSATATNSIISDANKILTGKATGPWVFPDNWLGKSRANEVVTGTLLSHVGGTITYNISGGVPNTAFTSTTEPLVGSGFGWTWNDYADGYGIPNSNQLLVNYGGTAVVNQGGGARQDTVTYVVVGDITYFRGAFLYSNNVFNDQYTDYVESYYSVYAVYHGTLNVIGNYSFNDNAAPSIGSHSVTFAFAATGRTRNFSYTGYNEQVQFSQTSVQAGSSFTIYVTGGAPNTVVRKRRYPTDFPFFAAYTEYTLDSSGNYTFSNEQIITTGSWTYNFYFVATGYTLNPTIGVFAGGLTISGTSSISFSALSDQLFSQITYTTNGTAPITWSRSGTLPGGVATTYQTYAGDPNYYLYQGSAPYYTHPTTGTYNITLTATDALGAIGTLPVTITVTPPTEVTITNLTDFTLVDSSGGSTTGFEQLYLYFNNDGTIYCDSQMEGNLIDPNNYATVGTAPTTWLTSGQPIDLNACAAYDIQFDEVSFSSFGSPSHALTYGSGGRAYGAGGTGVRLNLATARYFTVSAAASQFATQIITWGEWTSVVTVNVKIYLAGTNTLQSSCQINMEVYIPPGGGQ
jgi:hypothetical protein